MQSPIGARFLNPRQFALQFDFMTGQKQPEFVLNRDLAVVLLLVGDAGFGTVGRWIGSAQQRSRPVGALRLTIPCYPGLNALGYRISRLSGLQGDFVARPDDV
jgi:hypothetical protein